MICQIAAAEKDRAAIRAELATVLPLPSNELNKGLTAIGDKRAGWELLRMLEKTLRRFLQVGAEAQGLLTHLIHQFGAHDAVFEAGVVLDLGGGHQRAAELAALEDEGLELGTRGVHGGGVTGRTGADDDDVMDGG